jgi:hypothetical protein
MIQHKHKQTVETIGKLPQYIKHGMHLGAIIDHTRPIGLPQLSSHRAYHSILIWYHVSKLRIMDVLPYKLFHNYSTSSLLLSHELVPQTPMRLPVPALG